LTTRPNRGSGCRKPGEPGSVFGQGSADQAEGGQSHLKGGCQTSGSRCRIFGTDSERKGEAARLHGTGSRTCFPIRPPGLGRKVDGRSGRTRRGVRKPEAERSDLRARPGSGRGKCSKPVMAVKTVSDPTGLWTERSFAGTAESPTGSGCRTRKPGGQTFGRGRRVDGRGGSTQIVRARVPDPEVERPDLRARSGSGRARWPYPSRTVAGLQRDAAMSGNQPVERSSDVVKPSGRSSELRSETERSSDAGRGTTGRGD
jgi:hypothetical protein